MGEKTGIQWTDHTFNPWWGCTKISRACKRCYAATFAARWLRWGPDAPPREFGAKHWNNPLRWSEAAKRDGVRRRVFCASMADVFEARDNEHGPTLDRLRARLFELIEACDGLDWQLLTKRPENMVEMAPAAWRSGWPRHVWAGATVENQDTADERVPHLLAVPAAVRFLSCEPLTGLLVVRREWCGIGHRFAPQADDPDVCCCGRARAHHQHGIGWVIAGGESGPGAEPTHPDWFRSLRDQCDRVGTPFFFKQWGDWTPDQDGDRCITFDGHNLANLEPSGRNGHGTVRIRHVGKAAAGRLLDGREHNAFPVSAAP
jgi:protein gp37